MMKSVLSAAVLLPTLSILNVPGSSPVRRVPTVTPPPEPLIAEAPIWGADSGANGYAFLPVTLHGRAATVVINLNDEGDLALSTAALARLGLSLPDTTQSETLTIGPRVEPHIPVRHIRKADWSVPRPLPLPPVVGIVGVHFLTTHYDLLYDFPHRRVRLYAWPVQARTHHPMWLPPEIRSTDCGKRISIPPGAATFTGMLVHLDGHPVTGVLEMMPYGSDEVHDEKMNQGALDALALPAPSPRLRPMDTPPVDRIVKDQVMDVHITVGQHTFWTGPVKVFPVVDVERGLPSHTPVMLLNLTTIHHMVLFDGVSSGQVCISASSS